MLVQRAETMSNWINKLLIGVLILCIAGIPLAACSKPSPDGATSPPVPPGDIAPEIGKIAPDFTLLTMKGEIVTLSQFRGKPVLLTFWVVHCEGCIHEIPYLQEFYDKDGEEVVLLAVHVGDAREQIQKLLNTRRITYPILIDADEQLCLNYRHGAPATFAIDKNGVVREIKEDVFNSVDEIESMVQKMR